MDFGGDFLRKHELRAGFRLVKPGTVPWLSADDWIDGVVISIKDRDVRIVAIIAKRPGTGAFSRMIGAIAYAGLTPHVVAPILDTMPSILRRWKWNCRIVGRGDYKQEVWTPPPHWLLLRARER